MKSINERNLLIGLTLLGALLRLPVMASPLAGDEAISFNRYGHLPWKEVLFYYPDTNQHVLFSLLSNFSLWLLGDHEVSFRLPCFLACVLSVPLLFIVTARLFESRSTALVASALMVFCTPHLQYSLYPG